MAVNAGKTKTGLLLRRGQGRFHNWLPADLK